MNEMLKHIRERDIGKKDRKKETSKKTMALQVSGHGNSRN
jgi:hypothetical protein